MATAYRTIDHWYEETTAQASAKANAEKLECPVCFMPVHPTNIDRHIEVYHPGQTVVFLRDGGFDYAALDIETRVRVLQEDKEFDQNIEDAGKSFVRACQNLLRIHEALRYKRPGFNQYVANKPDLSEATAYRMVAVGKMSLTVTDIQGTPKALYMLANKATPAECRQAAALRSAAGELITPPIVREIIEQHGVTAHETIARLDDGARKGSEWVNEVAATGWIQPGDEEDARHIADTPEEVDGAIAKRTESHKVIGAQASGPTYNVEARDGVFVAVMVIGEFATDKAAWKAIRNIKSKLEECV